VGLSSVAPSSGPGFPPCCSMLTTGGPVASLCVSRPPLFSPGDVVGMQVVVAVEDDNGAPLRLPTSPSHARPTKDHLPSRAVLTRCPCGRERLVRESDLRRGAVKLCFTCSRRVTGRVAMRKRHAAVYAEREAVSEEECARLEEERKRLELERIVAASMVDFQRDVSYFAAMAQSATAILFKRRRWQVRTTLRQVTKAALLQCSSDPDQSLCVLSTPCGTAKCPYAPSELVDLPFPSVNGETPATHHRPSRHIDSGHGYSIEPAVAAVAEVEWSREMDTR
jgi:hypothetical protein